MVDAEGVRDSLPKSVYTKSDNRPLAERMGYIKMMDNFPNRWVPLMTLKKSKRQKIYNMSTYFNSKHDNYEFKSRAIDERNVTLFGRRLKI
ncbi:MAG: hypothetical protein CMQ02_10260 [Gammaproteobacteria bacterium]|nr:hypothetical protein [uncultured phage MedDCM-OCT-S08-C495]MAV33798.1 hypothetical protein [Gammaproteobacteria bacterium]BAR30943.1 hypothetical protein [uncultured Mediterranean phage uvMED]|tara:strand:+ start:2664 stop:2936 length:273 start_codon:yes stop_codon:yes gene_type:complete